ncbi:hypothetical protein R0011_01690 [Lacticaseibacillus rhamnosus R0011]|nr:hypothetical protein R0011_01690 [Lacticaseibacillus rhamnosus R0011]EHJ35435.1 hypothetical protein HMPREF0541_00310 [Lacticaseibacillus rhamnosus ATCC 21052]
MLVMVVFFFTFGVNNADSISFFAKSILKSKITMDGLSMNWRKK